MIAWESFGFLDLVLGSNLLLGLGTNLLPLCLSNFDPQSCQDTAFCFFSLGDDEIISGNKICKAWLKFQIKSYILCQLELVICILFVLFCFVVSFLSCIVCSVFVVFNGCKE